MKFHKDLNEKLWDKIQDGDKTSYELKQEVHDKLTEIADAFIEYMEIPEDAVTDIIITGSSASFNYTPHSDLDLHFKIDYDKVHEDCPVVEGFLWAVKSVFNTNHDISIYGIPVEVYAESTEENAVSNGIYSLRQNKWLKEPKPIEPTTNDAAVLAKYNELKQATEDVADADVAKELLNKIYEMRKAGLSEAGEFSTENLAFKKLRDDGVLDKLREMKKEKVDKELSLESYNEEIDPDEALLYKKLTRELYVQKTLIDAVKAQLRSNPNSRVGDTEVDIRELAVKYLNKLDYPRDWEKYDIGLAKQAIEDELHAKELAYGFKEGKPMDIEENVDTFCDKIDNVNDQLKELIKSLVPVPAKVVESLNSLISEANAIEEPKTWGIEMFLDTVEGEEDPGVVEFKTPALIDEINEYGYELPQDASEDLIKEACNDLEWTVKYIK